MMMMKDCTLHSLHQRHVVKRKQRREVGQAIILDKLMGNTFSQDGYILQS